MKKIIPLLILAQLSVLSLVAQKNFEGEIKYNISYEDMIEELKAQESMFPTEMTTQIKGHLSKTTQPTVAGNQISITNNKSQNAVVLLEIVGQKVAIKADGKDMEEERKEVERNMQVEYTKETKEILGYLCKKAIIKTPQATITVFYTNKLPNVNVSDQVSKIDGYPLQIISSNEMLTTISTATNIEEKDVEISMDIPDGYEVMSPEEFKSTFNPGQ